MSKFMNYIELVEILVYSSIVLQKYASFHIPNRDLIVDTLDGVARGIVHSDEMHNIQLMST